LSKEQFEVITRLVRSLKSKKVKWKMTKRRAIVDKNNIEN